VGPASLKGNAPPLSGDIHPAGFGEAINVMEEKKKSLLFIIFHLSALFFSVYLLTASVAKVYDNDAGKLRLEVVRGIVERHDLSVSEEMGIEGADGRYYSWLGIGSALLAVPFYMAAEYMGAPPENVVLAMSLLFVVATGVLVFLFCLSLGYSRRASVLTAVFFGLGTMAWPYAKHPFNRPVETFFVLLSVYLLYLYTVDRRVTLLLSSAFSFGIAFATRTTSILVLPPLVIMMLFSYSRESGLWANARAMARDSALFALAFLPFLGLCLWYNHYRFGSVLETGYSLIAARNGVDLFKGTSLLRGLGGLLVSPGKGFFYYSPVAVLFFFSIRSFYKRQPGLALGLVCLVLSYLLFHSKYVYWHGDWAWGPRHIFVITPFLIMPAAGIFDSPLWLRKTFPRVMVYSVFAVSFLVQLVAVSVNYQKYFLNLRYVEKLPFTVTYGEGIQPTIEPPPEVYFNWRRSPILAHIGSIREMAGGIRDYRYSELPEGAAHEEKIRKSIYMNVFDFWWLYRYFSGGGYSGFYAALALLLLASYSASRLIVMTRRPLPGRDAKDEQDIYEG
jgi:hypothetical protein